MRERERKEAGKSSEASNSETWFSLYREQRCTTLCPELLILQHLHAMNLTVKK